MIYLLFVKQRVSQYNSMILFFVATWVKVNSSPVSFGTKNNQYGTFTMPFTGDLAAMKLVNLHGYVTCDTRHSNYYSYWGCGSLRNQQVDVVITDDTNQVLLPIDALILNDDLTSNVVYRAPFGAIRPRVAPVVH